jgi:hypothetical protein
LVPSPQLQIIHPCGLKLPMSSSRTPRGLGATLEATARLLTRNDRKLTEVTPQRTKIFFTVATIQGNKWIVENIFLVDQVLSRIL